MADYNIGDSIRLPAAFHNLETGNPADPTTVVFKVRNEAGAITTKTYGFDAAVVRTGVGAYYYDFVPTAHGTWYWHWEGTGGNAQKTLERALFVRGTNF